MGIVYIWMKQLKSVQSFVSVARFLIGGSCEYLISRVWVGLQLKGRELQLFQLIMIFTTWVSCLNYYRNTAWVNMTECYLFYFNYVFGVILDFINKEEECKFAGWDASSTGCYMYRFKSYKALFLLGWKLRNALFRSQKKLQSWVVTKRLWATRYVCA